MFDPLRKKPCVYKNHKIKKENKSQHVVISSKIIHEINSTQNDVIFQLKYVANNFIWSPDTMSTTSKFPIHIQ